jgi:hypothetical protein
MEPTTLLILLLIAVVGAVLIGFKRMSKRDPLDEHPLRGTTRRSNARQP